MSSHFKSIAPVRKNEPSQFGIEVNSVGSGSD